MYDEFNTTEKVNACVFDTVVGKHFQSKKYNFDFICKSGYFARWGVDFVDDPLYAPAPEILDLEISVNGCPNACNFCYKGNDNSIPVNMSFDTFRKIVDKHPKTLTQIAFGITGVKTNPDFIGMLEYCRSVNIMPNFTLSGIDLTEELAKKIVPLVGAISVSVYQKDKNVGYDAIKLLTDLGLSQTNIHLMVSRETKDFVCEVIADRSTDKRLNKMNAIVFLMLKSKGRAKDYFHRISDTDFSSIIALCFVLNEKFDFKFGFDSCSAPHFEKLVKKKFPKDIGKVLLMMSESCESSLFSSYINHEGKFFPCSFGEKELGWENGVDVVSSDDFVRDVWNNIRVVEFRDKLLKTCVDGCRSCVFFKEINNFARIM